MKSHPTDRTNSSDSSNTANTSSKGPGATEKSENKKKTDEEFPGYPHYPANEDIMHPSNRMEKISPDPEKITRSGAYIDTRNIDKPVSSSLDTAPDVEDDLIIIPGTEADVTKDDLLLLGEKIIDSGEEESVDNKVLSGDIDAGLDVPGEELDDSNEELGEEDEENNYYSLGGDRQENLEEN